MSDMLFGPFFVPTALSHILSEGGDRGMVSRGKKEKHPSDLRFERGRGTGVGGGDVLYKKTLNKAGKL